MLSKLNQYFEGLFEQDTSESNKEHTIELATAVLMLEISLADGNIDENEKHTIKALLKKEHLLNDQELDDLVKLAESEVDQAVSLQSFTRLLTDHLNMTERVDVIKNLWRIAYSDAVIDKYEEYHIRKIADLLYVSHADYIKAKHAADDH